MNRILLVGLAVAAVGCDAPFWVKHKREDAEIARQQEARLSQKANWRAEETRHLFALCLDIAKFEKQWSNFSEWSFDAATGDCTVTYKKPPSEKKTRKQCADEWLLDERERNGDLPAPGVDANTRRGYFECVIDTFSKKWSVQAKE